MSEKYFSLSELLKFIEEPNRNHCERIYTDNKYLFETAKWSKIKHQAWKWGYLGHICDALNIAFRIYANLSVCRPLGFSLSDALLVIFLHDLEKPWKYAGNETEKEDLHDFEIYRDFITYKTKQYWFKLTAEHKNALKYVHGEWVDFNPIERVQGPLAAFVHTCDTISARIWYEYPKQANVW